MVRFCDLLGTSYAPVSKILSVKRNDHPKIVLEVASYVITGET